MNKISYIIILVIYLIMFLNLTIFGRTGMKIYGYNLIPFKTLIRYIAYPSIYNTTVNIIGNIVILMPVQFLIMKIFNINKFKISLSVDILLSLLIEVIQLMSKTGVFDIDDIILNVFGMSIIYFIMMNKNISKYKKIIVISIISLIITLYLFEMFSLYHFGDIPTILVLLRLIIVYIIIDVIIHYIYSYIKK